MFEENKIHLEIDTKELQEKIEKALIDHIEQIIFDALGGKYHSRDSYDFRHEIVLIFKKSLREIADLDSKEIRREVKQEVIDRSVEKITSLDKKEVLKTLLTK